MSSQETSDVAPPAVPPRSTQRDSTSNSTSHRDSLYRASPQISPVQPAHPVLAEDSSTTPVPPQIPEKTAQPAPPTQPTQAQQVQSLFPAAAVSTETIKTKREELEEGDAHWKWKIGFRAVSIVVGLIGIGCAAWITAHFTADSFNSYSYSYYYYYYYFDDAWTIPWTLITFGLSVVWSSACVIVFFSRRPAAPVHPGAQVGCDLILWMAFIVTATFAIVGTVSVGSWGSDGTLGYSSSSGYTMASNGTWVWNSTQSSYYSSSRSCDSSSYTSCAQQDAYINALWDAKTLRYNLDLTVTVCQFIAVVVHIILFIWACVDTHRRNSRGVTKDAEKLAAEIVMNMVKNGAIIPAPGNAHLPPMAQYGAPMGSAHVAYPQPQFYPHQQFPWQIPGQYHAPTSQGKAPIPQPAVASSSNEKGAGPQYA